MSIRKRIQSFGFAFKGIYTLLQREPNARIHLLATVVVCLAGFYFSITKTEWTILALTVGSVFAAESFNTAIEALTDLASPDFHPLAAIAKDVAAAGVLFTAIAALIVGICIFGPYLINLA